MRVLSHAAHRRDPGQGNSTGALPRPAEGGGRAPALKEVSTKPGRPGITLLPRRGHTPRFLDPLPHVRGRVPNQHRPAGGFLGETLGEIACCHAGHYETRAPDSVNARAGRAAVVIMADFLRCAARPDGRAGLATAADAADSASPRADYPVPAPGLGLTR
jgi:hypothetical protein